MIGWIINFRICWSISLFLLLFSNVFAQKIEHLSDRTNVYLYFDSDSILWVSSLNAINRYDGTENKIYWPNSSLPNSLPEGISQSEFFEDQERNIWFTTINYLVKYNRATDNFESFQLNDHASSYRLIDITPSYIYLQIDSSVYRFSKKSNFFEKIIDGFRAVEFSAYFDAEEDLLQLYGTRWNYGMGLLKLSKTKDDFSIDTLFTDLETRKVKLFKEEIYFTSSQGLNKTNSSDELTWIKSNIKDIEISFDEQLVYCSESEIFKYDKDESKVLELNNFSGYNIINPKEGLFFISEKDKGVSIISGKNPWNFYETNSTIFKIISLNDASVFSTYNGDVYIRSENQIIKIDNFRLKPILIPEKEDFPVFAISRYKQSKIFEDGSFVKSFNISSYKIRGGAVLKNTIIISHDKGIVVFDENGIELSNFGGLEILDITYLDSDSYIYNVEKRGILINNLVGVELKRISVIPTDCSIHQFFELDDSTILIASDKGIQKLDKRTWTISQFKYPNYFIQSLIYDGNNELWFGTRNGLYHEDQNGSLKKYTEKNGLPSHTFSHGCAEIDSDGTLYFGTNKGILYFHPDSIKDIDYNPSMMLTSLKIHDHEWADDTLNIEVLDKIDDLEYNQNTLTFDFVAIDYDPNNHPQYSAYLEGYDVDTTSLGDQSKITYPNLQPGKYRFHFSACTLSGYCRDEFETFDFTIDPPYWETWWFRTLAVLAGLGIIGFGIGLYLRNRLREQRFVFEKQQLVLKTELQLQQERNRIADELHDELGGKLSSIKFASKKVQKATHIDEVKKITERVSEISTELIESMRSIIWAMDTQNDTLSSLQANIRSYASTVGRDNDLSMRFDFQDSEEEIIVKGQIRHHLFLSIKEILNNIMKHSSANEVEIKMKAIDNKLKTVIVENGQGFDINEISKFGKGIRSIDKRMKTIGSTIIYENLNRMIITVTSPLS